MVLLLIIIYLLILLMEIPGLMVKKQHKELLVFMVFFSISLYMGLAFFYRWPLSGPFESLLTFMERYE